MRKLTEQTKTSVESITQDISEVQLESDNVSSSIETFSKNLSQHVEKSNVAMSAIDHIMEHIDEINKAIVVIATFTESGTTATEEISSKMNTLQQHFEKTKQMTFKTGKSLYTAGQGVNEILKKM